MVVRVLADEIGIHFTQLEPGDLVLRHYCLNGICSFFDDTWEAWTEKLGNYVRMERGHAMSREESHQSSSWVTLDDVVRGTVDLLSPGRRKEVIRKQTNAAEHSTGIE